MRTEVHCVRLHFLSESNNLPKMNKRRRDSLNLDETTVNELQVPFETSQSAALQGSTHLPKNVTCQYGTRFGNCLGVIQFILSDCKGKVKGHFKVFLDFLPAC